MPAVNHLAVLVSVVAAQLLGFVWYSVAFGKSWAVGYRLPADAMAKTNPASLGITLAGAIVFTYGMAVLFGLLGPTGLSAGLVGGALVFVGIIAPRYVLHAIFGKIKGSSILIDLGFDLLVSVVTGGILGVWPV